MFDAKGARPSIRTMTEMVILRLNRAKVRRAVNTGHLSQWKHRQRARKGSHQPSELSLS